MLDKIRLHSCGELGSEYHDNLGKPATADGACLNFLRVNYPTCVSASSLAEATRRYWSGVLRRVVVSMKAIS
jgi:hypothetical protein